MWGELASHKRLINPPPQFSRLGIQGPALVLLCFVLRCLLLCIALWRWRRVFLSILSLISFGWYATKNNCMCNVHSFIYDEKQKRMSELLKQVENESRTEDITEQLRHLGSAF